MRRHAIRNGLIGALLAASLLGCGLYVAPHLPVASNSEISYRVIPLRTDTIATATAPFAPRLLLPPLKPVAKTESYDYVMGPGDLLSLIIYTFDASGQQSAIRVFPEGLPIAGENEFLVAADGSVTLPYVGRLQVEGKPFTQVKREIRNGLGRYFIEPQFEAHISSFAHGRALVAGEVAEPGEVFLSHTPLTVAFAIRQAGGLLPTAALSEATLTHASGLSEPLDLKALYYLGDASANRTLMAGDTLTIARSHANQIFITGEVAEPQALTMHPMGYSLTEALQKAGGIDPITGDASQVYVLRTLPAAPGKEQVHIYHLNGADLAAFAAADQFPLLPRDIVYVSMNPITQWNRLISQFLPSGLSTIVGPQVN